MWYGIYRIWPTFLCKHKLISVVQKSVARTYSLSLVSFVSLMVLLIPVRHDALFRA